MMTQFCIAQNELPTSNRLPRWEMNEDLWKPTISLGLRWGGVRCPGFDGDPGTPKSWSFVLSTGLPS